MTKSKNELMLNNVLASYHDQNLDISNVLNKLKVKDIRLKIKIQDFLINLLSENASRMFQIKHLKGNLKCDEMISKKWKKKQQ